MSFIYRFSQALFLSLLLIAPHSHACSLAFWNNNNQANVVARTMDFFQSDEPSIVIYPRGIERDGKADQNNLRWKSKYGSVVVTAFHTDIASDGMNEAGLAAHLLYLDNSAYEKNDSHRPNVSNAAWVQYLLDNFKTVDEVVEASQKVQISATRVLGQEWPLHLAVEDASGDAAIIEFINGKMNIHHGPQYQVVTNEPDYDTQLDNLKRYQAFGGSLALPGEIDPMSRFVRVDAFLRTLPHPSDYIQAMSGVLSVIRTVSVPPGAIDRSGTETEDAWPTRWITVADLTNKIYYFSSTTDPNSIWFKLDRINFSEGGQIISLDPTNSNMVGDMSKKVSANNRIRHFISKILDINY